MNILKGIDAGRHINTIIQNEMHKWDKKLPKLAIIRVGERPDDMAYERGAKKKMETVGFDCEVYSFSQDIDNEAFIKEFDKINCDPCIDGILLLRPLPAQLDEETIVNRINPNKDLDGISPVNMAKVYSGDESGFAPCTAEAVIALLDYAGIDATGKNVVVVGRSLVIGRPVSMLLLKKNATVTICHTRTRNMSDICRKADIVVAAAGCAKMITADYVGKDAVVIDVGINVDGNGNLCGDVDIEDIKDKAAIATPVPGGVGSVTTSVLALHLFKAAKNNN